MPHEAINRTLRTLRDPRSDGADQKPGDTAILVSCACCGMVADILGIDTMTWQPTHIDGIAWLHEPNWLADEIQR